MMSTCLYRNSFGLDRNSDVVVPSSMDEREPRQTESNAELPQPSGRRGPPLSRVPPNVLSLRDAGPKNNIVRKLRESAKDCSMEKDHLWSIILAGGEGERIRPLIQHWLGHHKPKQYCAFVGRRSMFQHTLDRADLIASPERRVTVIARSHESEARFQFGHRPAGILLVQPANRDTAAGVFLALSHVRARDPEATVVVFPSDHFVCPEDRFVELVRNAIQCAKDFSDRLILLGARPYNLELEYGWIRPSLRLGGNAVWTLRAIDGYHEKPDSAVAQRYMGCGGVWNTMVFAAGLDLLWKLGWLCFPAIMERFERLVGAIDTPDEMTVLESIYDGMPSRNFSSHLLERAFSNAAVLEMQGILWCDWGKPERIVSTLNWLGKKPAFPPEIVTGGVPCVRGQTAAPPAGLIA